MNTSARRLYRSEEQILSSQGRVCGPNIPDKTCHTSPLQVHLHNMKNFQVELKRMIDSMKRKTSLLVWQLIALTVFGFSVIPYIRKIVRSEILQLHDRSYLDFLTMQTLTCIRHVKSTETSKSIEFHLIHRFHNINGSMSSCHLPHSCSAGKRVQKIGFRCSN